MSASSSIHQQKSDRDTLTRHILKPDDTQRHHRPIKVTSQVNLSPNLYREEYDSITQVSDDLIHNDFPEILTK